MSARLIAAVSATLALASAPAFGEDPATQLALALDRDHVDIGTRFTGADIAAFAVAQPLDPGDYVFIVLRGPDEVVRVNRRTRQMGLWLSSDEAQFADTPGYLALAGDAPAREAVATSYHGRLGLGPHAPPARPVGARPAMVTASLDAYREALARLRAREGLYTPEPQTLERYPLGLSRAHFHLPASAPTGTYEARAYVFRDGVPVAEARAQLDVRTVGIGRWVSDMARERPLLYGLMAIGLALSTGALSAFMRR